MKNSCASGLERLSIGGLSKQVKSPDAKPRAARTAGGEGQGRGGTPSPRWLAGFPAPHRRRSVQVLAGSQGRHSRACARARARTCDFAPPPSRSPQMEPLWELRLGPLHNLLRLSSRRSRLSPAPTDSPIAVRLEQKWVEPRKFERSSAPREPIPGNWEVVEEKHPAWTVRRGGK